MSNHRVGRRIGSTVCERTDELSSSSSCRVPGQLTVICADAECEKVPFVPRTVNVVVRPLVAVERTVTVSVDVTPPEVLVTDEGLNVPLVLRGSPLTLRLTMLEPFTAVIVTVYVPDEPRFTVCEPGDKLMVKSADAPVTVSVVVPAIPPDVAVIVVAPCASAVARPEVLIVATFVLDEVQVTDNVMSFEELSE